MSQENLQTMIMQNLGGGGGVREVYYGIVQVVNEDYSITWFRSKKIYSTFNMSARREGEDFPARCISLLEEGSHRRPKK